MGGLARGARRLTLLGATSLLVLAPAPIARASSIEHPPSDIGTPIVFQADPGEVVDLHVSEGAGNSLVVTDAAGNTIRPGNDCMGSGSTVTCSYSPLDGRVWLYLADGADRVDSALSRHTLSVYAGGGDDWISITGDSSAYVQGGPGDDDVEGPVQNAPRGVFYDDHSAAVTVTLGDGSATTGNGSAGENDTIGDAVEYVRGGTGADTIEGDASDNGLVGCLCTNDGGHTFNASGPDVLRGHGGRDSLYGLNSRSTLDGGSGDDDMSAGLTFSQITGGSGVDRAFFSDIPSRYREPLLLTLDDVADDGALAPGARAEWYPGVIGTADLAAWVPRPGNLRSDVETIYGGDAGDVIVGDADANEIVGDGWGASGDDTIVGGAGRDAIYANGGDDTVWARDGEADLVDCESGQDTAIVDDLDTVQECETVYSGNDLPPPPDPLAPPDGPLPIPDPVHGFHDVAAPSPGAPPPGSIDPGSAGGGPAPTALAAPLPALRLAASRRVVRRGGRVVLSGLAAARRPVILYAASGRRGHWHAVGRTVARSNGRFRFRPLRPRTATRYQARSGVQASAPVKVLVRRSG